MVYVIEFKEVANKRDFTVVLKVPQDYIILFYLILRAGSHITVVFVWFSPKLDTTDRNVVYY